MRCPHCSGEIPEGSHFCGICGNHIAEGPRPSAPPSFPPSPAASSPSLFELPAARGPRLARIFVVVTLNLILAGAGAAMIASYIAKRAEAERRTSETPEAAGAAKAATGPEAGAVATAGEPGSADEPVLAATVGTGAANPAVGGKAGPASDPQTKEYAARIDELAARHQRQLHGCYQKAAKTLPADEPLEGRVDIRFTIMPDGRATGGRSVANTTGSEALASCLVGVVEGWSFPPGASKPLDFVWPFRFRSRQ